MANPNELTQQNKYLNGGNIDYWNRVYPSLASANAAIPDVLDADGVNLRSGKFVQIGTEATKETYWWKGGFKDKNLIPYFTPSGFSFQGTYNALSNLPPLSDSLGQKGWTYTVTVAGEQDLGSGVLSLKINDQLIYDGGKWNQIPSIEVYSPVFSNDSEFQI